MSTQTLLTPGKKAFLTFTLMLFLLACSDDQFLIDSTTLNASGDLNVTGGSIMDPDDCSGCTYVVPADARIIDGITLGLQPGDVIGLQAGVAYANLVFRNIVGTLQNPIIIRNCGGVARIDGTGKGYGIQTEYSAHFRITGGNDKGNYGIVVSGGTMSVNLAKLSTHFEVDHLEIQHSGFAGIMAKTDPGCDEATWRENFLMKGVALHNNYIHDTGGEGIYAGNSFYLGMNTPCGVKLPHEIHYIRIFGNIVKNTGWEAIQLGCATKGASIHGNTVENYGLANKQAQNNGIQIGTGTGGLCYNNLIKGGTGNGLIVLGQGDNVIYNNVIEDAGNFGVFCDERYAPGPGFKFLNNTILNPKSDGIRIYADLVPMNVIVNNMIINPGSYSTYTYPRSPEDAFIYKLNDNVKIEMANNYFAIDSASFQLEGFIDSQYRTTMNCPVVDKGADISVYHNINTDFYFKPRLKGMAYDIGAVEQF